MYQPWQTLPFDILDFSEFLPLLKREHSLLGCFVAIVRYYAGEHGRFNVIPYAMLASKWTLLHDRPTMWQLARFAQMLLIVLGVFFFLRKLRLSDLGAATGALLFVTAGTAAPAWLRLTMAEPAGTLFLLGAGFLAIGYSEAKAWKQRGLLIAALLGACVLSKEMLVGVVPFVLLLALWRRSNSHLCAAALRQRGRWLLAMAFIGVSISLLPITILALRAPPQAFTGMYGQAPITMARLAVNVALFALPASPILFPLNTLNFIISNYLFVALVILGHWQGNRSPRASDFSLSLSGIALTLPVAAALIYLPWPQVQPFYGLPFLLGPAILLGQAVGAIEGGVSGPWISGVGCILILAGTACSSQQLAAISFAQRRSQLDIARYVAGSHGRDSILVAVRRKPLVAWEGLGPTIRRYSSAIFDQDSLPPITDILCEEANRLEEQTPAGTLLISMSYECGPLRNPTHVSLQPLKYITWPRVAVRHGFIWTYFRIW